MTGSDISEGEIAEAKRRAEVCFKQADFCNLSKTFAEQFDIIIAMDNALPHMLSSVALENTVKSIVNQVK